MSRVLKVDEYRNKPFDLTGLAEWGEVEDIAFKLPTPFKTDEYEQALIRILRAMSFDPDVDSLAVVGRTINCVFAALVMVKHYERLNVLIYSSIEERYVLRTFKSENFECIKH